MNDETSRWKDGPRDENRDFAGSNCNEYEIGLTDCLCKAEAKIHENIANT